MPRRRRTPERIAKPFDATTKYLLERDPAGWLAYASPRPAASATVVDSDLSTILSMADKVIRVDGPPAWLTSDLKR